MDKLGMHCSICASSDIHPVFKGTQEEADWILDGVKYSYIQCRSCGFLQCTPIPNSEVLLEFYKDQYPYEWFKKNEWFKKLQAKHRKWKIRKLLNGVNKVLDFGCGHGFFVREIASPKRSSYGFDIGAEKISSKANATITHLNQLEAYTEKDFDLITAWHVLEHMQDQDAILKNLHHRLMPKGKLVLAVPNTNSYTFQRVAQKWGWLQQPYVHINQYNAGNLGKLLEKNGFMIDTVKTTDTWDQNIYDYLISKWVYRNKSRNPVRSYGTSFSGAFFFRLNQFVRLCFTPLSYIRSFLFSSRMDGNELMIIAQKAPL